MGPRRRTPPPRGSPGKTAEPVVRLDAFLKNAGLFKARSQARRACDEGRVRIGGNPARGSRAVRAGEVLEVEAGGHRLRVEVLDLPQRPVARSERGRYVRELRREALPAEVLSFDDEP